MRIMLIGKEIKSQNDIKCFSDMWAYHLPKNLQANGVEIAYFSRLSNSENAMQWGERLVSSAKGFEAILATGVRYFTTIPLDVCKYIRDKFPGIVSQVYDASMLDNPHVDLTLTIKDSTEMYRHYPDRMKRHHSHNKCIGWAADHEVFTPKKGEKLRIFIDHPIFDCSASDFTLTAMMNLHQLKVPFEARTLTDEGIVDIDTDNIVVKEYKRTPVPSAVFANELNEAHIFVCTHKESLGQTVIEAAMAGCFVLTPPNSIPEDRIKLVNHDTFNGEINWDNALRNINPEKNRTLALQHTWDAVAKRTIQAISSYDKPKA